MANENIVLRPNRGHSGHPVLKGSQNRLIEYARSFGFNDEADVLKAIESLAEWAKQQQHFEVKELDRDYLETIFFNSKCSLAKAKQIIDRRLQLTTEMPELLTGFDLKNEFEDVRKCYKQALSPWPTESNSRILVSKYLSNFFDCCEPIEYCRYLLVSIEYQMIKEVATTHIAIADIRDVPMADLLLKVNLLMIKKTITIIVQGFGARLMGIHLITGSKVFDALFALIKPAFPQKLQKRIYWHNSPDTLTDYIPKDKLPSDFGGHAPSIDELNDALIKDMTESQDFACHLKRLETYKTDETKRIDGGDNVDFGLQGSFRTLNID